MEDAVLELLRAKPASPATHQVRTCTISAPSQLPWGRPYRLVEWTFKHDSVTQRCVVAADSTPHEIAAAVLSHVPGRRYCESDG
jgi:hypothetical protein